MKANAPEKIYVYIPDDDIVGRASIKKGIPHQYVDIEYVRKDAFIEKATLWLLTNASDYCNLHNSYDTKELVEDFVNAMKRN